MITILLIFPFRWGGQGWNPDEYINIATNEVLFVKKKKKKKKKKKPPVKKKKKNGLKLLKFKSIF